MRLGFVTCHPDKLKTYFPTAAEPAFIPSEPWFTPDDQLAVNYFRQQGCTIDPIIWGESIDALHAYDALIIRSPWDYMDNTQSRKAFLHWINSLEKTGICLFNSAKMSAWLIDKHYLSDLAKENVSIIPTIYFEIGTTIDLVSQFNQFGQFIMKPCISAAGVGLYHIDCKASAIQAEALINEHLKTDAYMLQTFIQEITTHGEWSFIFLNGKLSHAVHKQPARHSIFVHAERGGSLSLTKKPPQKLMIFAAETYQQINPAFQKAIGLTSTDEPLYLRLDIIETENQPVLIECEGVEPELFFRANPNSIKRFYQAVIAKLAI